MERVVTGLTKYLNTSDNGSITASGARENFVEMIKYFLKESLKKD